MSSSTSSLKDTWQVFRQSNPKTRIRDAAKQLGVSEAELVATGVGETCTRLKSEFKTMLAELSKLGEVMALTRSNAMVHEVTGQFNKLAVHGDTGLFFRPGLDTRYFLGKWKFAFAVNENDRLSLQFFDKQGTAAHKIYMREQSNVQAYNDLVAAYRDDEQSAFLDVEEPVAAEPAVQTADINSEELRDAWSKIRHVHDGNRIIRSYSSDRQAVFRALGEQYARQLSADCVEALLTTLAEKEQPLMLFGMNECAVQSYAGTINKLVQYGPWFNVLDPGFNIHLLTGEIGAVWLTRKPSDDGWVNTLDVFDKQGNEIMVLTDNRKRGEQESPAWTELVTAL